MSKISKFLDSVKKHYRADIASKMLDLSDVTVFSQNCIGGVMYHDCHSRFLSPTVNIANISILSASLIILACKFCFSVNPS